VTDDVAADTAFAGTIGAAVSPSELNDRASEVATSVCGSRRGTCSVTDDVVADTVGSACACRGRPSSSMSASVPNILEPGHPGS
jgi:hypothetical protein